MILVLRLHLNFLHILHQMFLSFLCLEDVLWYFLHKILLYYEILDLWEAISADRIMTVGNINRAFSPQDSTCSKTTTCSSVFPLDPECGEVENFCTKKEKTGASRGENSLASKVCRAPTAKSSKSPRITNLSFVINEINH